MAEKAKIKMDAETLKKLKGFSIATKAIPFTPNIKDIDPEFLPTVHIGPMSNTDAKKLKLMTVISYSGKTITGKEASANNDFLEKMTKQSVVGLDNLIDISTGTVVPFQTQKGQKYISDKLWEQLPILLKTLITNEIMAQNGLA